MRFHKSLQQLWQNRRQCRQNRRANCRKPSRLNLEHLEHRLMPTTFNAPDVPTLIADINTANTNGVSNTINLTAPTGIYTLAAVNNTTDGPTALPVITSPFLLTINGNWATIEPSTAAGTPAFRLFDVAGTGALTLKNVSLLNGYAFGAGVSAQGGAIYNKGKLTLNGAVLQSNKAQGSKVTAAGAAGQDAAGGGIYSSGGSLTLTGSTLLQLDVAFAGGGAGGGGNAFGGGIYATLTKVVIGAGSIIESCQAAGGSAIGAAGASGGNAFGGGLYATGTSTALELVALTNATLQNDTVGGAEGSLGAPAPVGFTGGPGGNGGSASGGGLFVNDVTLTLNGDHIQNDSAVGGGGRIGGSGSNAGAGGAGGDARGGGLAANNGSVSESSFLVLQGNMAGGGPGGHGYVGTHHGGAGGAGGNAFGGGMYTAGTTVKIAVAPTIQNNAAEGGSGGGGGGGGTAGGNGGNGGNACGGALYASASGTISLVLENAIVENNGAAGDRGSSGGSGPSNTNSGAGGNGGNSDGGALYLAQNATLLSNTIKLNSAGFVPFPFSDSATGGSGIAGGHAGNGGNSAGGALFVAAGTITLASSAIDSNEALGGNGGNTAHVNPAGTAGIGGTATGGAVAITGGILSVKSCTLESNKAMGGHGGGHLTAIGVSFSGTHAFQGAGGGAYGGALYISGGTLHLTLDDAENNVADAGFSVDGAQSTAADGGGLYKAGGATSIDAFTATHIINNTDSDGVDPVPSDDNIGP